MKRLYYIFFILLCCTLSSIYAQQYTVDGRNYTLKTEVEGTLSLLWNTIDGDYRYFSKKGNLIVELKNTKENGSYQEEYKAVLKEATSDVQMMTDDVELTLASLRNFFNEYNAKADPNYTYEKPGFHIKTRLGAFIGMSNNAYFVNPDNSYLPAFGIDFELVDEVQAKRHAIVIQYRHLVENSDYIFNSSQFSLNYRFKFIKSDRFDAFVNFKWATYTNIFNVEVVTPESGDFPGTLKSGGKFQIPAALGLGFDYAIGNGYLTCSFNDFVAAIDDNGEFPMEFTLGYKFNL
jgi:hypothetical protein